MSTGWPRPFCLRVQKDQQPIEELTCSQHFISKNGLSQGTVQNSPAFAVSSLYTNLYGSRTLAYWTEKDDTPKDPKCIFWAESRLAMKRLSRAQRRIDTKLLCNHCGFEKIKFNRKEQDTHTCPVCNGQEEDRNRMFACQAPSAVKNKEKELKGLTKLMDDLDTSPDLTTMIIRCIRHVQNNTIPTARSVGYENFGSGITTMSIF